MAVFGQKDFQQAVIIKRMVEDLNFNVRIVACPIVREKDGLAMSSRNKYLTPAQRNAATVLYQSLQLAEREYAEGNTDSDAIIKKVRDLISNSGHARIDYVEMADAATLGEAKLGMRDVVLALAVFLGKTRLIDNIVLEHRQNSN